MKICVKLIKFILSFHILILPVLANHFIRQSSSITLSSKVNNLVIDDANSKIYVGAVNDIFVLNATNLAILQKVSTGPVFDSPLCSYDLTSCVDKNSPSIKTDNINKILQLTPSGDVLACGSTRQGVCNLYNTLDIANIVSNGTVPVAANSPSSSTVSLIDNKTGKLYVATTFSSDSPYRDNHPAVATRESSTYYPINFGSIEGEAAVQIRAEHRSRFVVDYVDVFKYEHYVFWAAVQNRNVHQKGGILSALITNPLVTKLIRVCADDERPNLQLDQDTCFIGVGGKIESEQYASVVYDNRVVSSISGKRINNKVIVVAGTEAGDVLQFTLASSLTNGESHITNKPYTMTKYAEFNSGVGSITFIKFLNTNEYVLSGSKQLTIFRLSSCNRYTDCDSCAAANDPLCGWCLLEGKCSQADECRKSEPTAYITDKCPKIGEGKVAIPMNISLDEIRKIKDDTVFLPIENLPQPEDFKYECYFGTYRSRGFTWSVNGITCEMPEKFPKIGKENDFLDLPISLHAVFDVKAPSTKRISNSNSIATFDFTFYTCKTNKMCSTCSTSKWDCKWCSGRNACLSTKPNNSSSCIQLITNPASCMQIDSSAISEILIPDRSNYTVQFPVINWSAPKSDGSEYFCKVLLQTTAITKASIKNQRVTCDSIEYSFDDNTKIKKIGLELMRNSVVIDKTNISVYKCSEMASDCSQCMALDPKFSCTWCSGKCGHVDQCSSNTNFSGMKADNLCINPIISNFEPKSGPMEGGTIVSIYGTDLGSKIDDVKDRVYIGGYKCRVIDFEVSKKIVCITEKGSGYGPVKITIGSSARRTVDSVDSFEYLEIFTSSVYPNFGPISGGTSLSVYGSNLNIGSNISIHLDNFPCVIDIDRNSSEIISCKTSESNRSYTVSAIRLQIDNAVKVINSGYEYRPNPAISKIFPTMSFKSGGVRVNVEGSNFDALLTAQMYLLSSDDATVAEIVSGLGVCEIHNSTLMSCQSPKVLSDQASYYAGFFMDNVKEVRNLGKDFMFKIVPDPEIDTFKEIKLQPADQTLMILTGNYLSAAASVSDYEVFIGTDVCAVVLLDFSQLLCRIPEVQPLATNEIGISTYNNYPLVVVKIGNLRYEVGSIEFEATFGGNFGVLRMPVIRVFLLFIILVFIILLITFFIITMWKKRSGERERDYKRIQQQMEQMESNVRNECKIAFAELQTDMTDLTLTIEDIGIPYKKMNEFLKNLLFQDATMDYSFYFGYPNSTGGSIYVSQLPVTQFESLVFNRQFIFLIVHMLESNPSISSNERSAVSSAIFSCISRNMEYCTEVVFTLLEKHIENSYNNKTDHLLFRKSESVVEKLFSYWLSICMFPEISSDQNGIAKSFYLLYRALKYQIEKGPIDAVTGNSRYSLNEQKLLREHVDGQAITLIIIPFENFDQFPIQLRVLVCDTITQVKEKLLDLLYKNQGYHNRITVEQFDLVWNNKREIIILTDDEKPSERGEKKLNTIGSYNIPQSTTITMEYSTHSVSHPPNNFTYRSGSSDTTCSAWSSTHLLNNSSNMSVSPPPIGNIPDRQYSHLKVMSNNQNKSNTLDGKRSFNSSQLKSSKKVKANEMNLGFTTLSPDFHSSSNIPEVYLTRLLTCKGSIQKFVESFFENILLVPRKDEFNESFVTMKYVCDFFDYQAQRLGINDDQIVFTWKKNAIVLRLWMNFINNPDFIFDLKRQNHLNQSLTVIGQTLMDCFSATPYSFSKESPSSKLLFAKEINRYRPSAMRMFDVIKAEAPITDKKFYTHINLVSQTMNESLNRTHSLSELLNWAKGNALPLVEILNSDEISLRHRLGEKLQQIVQSSTNENDHIYATLN
uniref:Sema domain-containing protein n=1 Tax=Rhabditophanes sp. KR3021 TaxID=114890 RepID=A0AC35U6B2_9BILA